MRVRVRVRVRVKVRVGVSTPNPNPNPNPSLRRQRGHVVLLDVECLQRAESLHLVRAGVNVRIRAGFGFGFGLGLGFGLGFLTLTLTLSLHLRGGQLRDAIGRQVEVLQRDHRAEGWKCGSQPILAEVEHLERRGTMVEA